MRVAIIDDDGAVAVSYPIDIGRLRDDVEPGAALAVFIESVLPIDWNQVEAEV